MRFHTLTLLAVLALVAAACGGGEGDDTSTTAAPEVEAVLLSYNLEPGTSLEYEVDLDQTIDMTASGDRAALGEDELPGEMSIGINGTSVLTHTVSEGPEPDTYTIDITGDFSDLDFSGTIDGEPVESDEIPEMAEMGPIDVTLVVDEQGNIIPENTGGPGEDLLGSMGGFDMLQQFGPGPGQFLGPPFPDEDVTVGDTWSDTVEIPGMPEGDAITTQSDSEVVGTDTIDGNDVFVIETTSTTSAFEFDFAELLVGFMSAFIPEDADDEQQAEIDAIIEELRFLISVDETVGDLTTWFDAEAGVARQADFANTTHMVMDLAIPDETTGELVEFDLDMSIDQEMAYRLVDDGTEG